MKTENLKLKIIFFGSSDFVSPILKKLQEKHDVLRVINSPEQLNKELTKQLKRTSPDLFVVASFGKILSSELLEIPKLGSINIHPSLLPKYRGASPVQTAILNGDKLTGVTFIKMDAYVDHGPIIEQFEEPIFDSDTFETLSKRLFKKAADAIEDVMVRFTKDQTGIAQDNSKATYTKLLTKEDGYIDLEKFQISNFKFQIERAMRAFYPWPGVWTKYSLTPPTPPKTLIKLLPGEKIQVEGKKPMSYKDFINGYEKGQEFLREIGLFSN